MLYWQPGLLAGQSRLHDVVLRSEPSFRTDRANSGSLALKMKEQKLSVQNTAVKSVQSTGDVKQRRFTFHYCSLRPLFLICKMLFMTSVGDFLKIKLKVLDVESLSLQQTITRTCPPGRTHQHSLDTVLDPDRSGQDIRKP